MGKDKSKFRKTGEYQHAHQKRKEKAELYNLLNNACRKAEETGESTVEVGNYKFFLSSSAMDGIYSGCYTEISLCRVKKQGICVVAATRKYHPFWEILWPFRKTINYAPKDSISITRVEKDGKEMTGNDFFWYAP